MTDIASLGLKIDSSEAGKASKDLDALVVAGKKAETQFAKIERAARMGGQGTQEYRQALGDAYGMTQKLSDSQVSAIRSYETLIAKTTLLNQGRGREAAQLVALRKAGTTADTEYGKVVAALSGNLYDLEQQGGKTDGTFTRFANTLTKRFVLGYLTTQIRQLAGSIVDLNTELAKTGDVGRFTGIGSQNLQGIQHAGALSGVNSGKMLDDMTGFARQVTLARQGLGDLNTLFKLNGQSAKDTQDAFYKVADRVKNARTDVEKFSILQSAGLPATREYVKLMEQGGASLKEQAANAPKIDDETIRKAQELEKAFNGLKETVSNFLKRDFVEFGENVERLAARFSLLGTAVKDALRIPASPFDYAFNRLSSYNDTQNSALRNGLLKLGQDRLNSYDAIPTGGKGGGSGKPTETADNLAARQKINSLQQQYIGLLGQTATVEQQVLAVRLQIQANQMNPDATKLTKEQIANLERLARERALGIDQIKASTDAENVAAATIGMSTGAAAAYTAAQNAMNEAKRAVTGLSDAQKAAIEAEAESLGRARQRADDLRFEYDTFSGAMREVGSNLRQGQSLWVAFGNAGANALGKIADRLMDMASQGLWNAAFGGKGGGGGIGGLFSSLFGGGGGGGAGPIGMDGLAAIHHSGYGPGDRLLAARRVPASTFDNAPRFHKGIGPGERAAIIRNDESVLTPGQMKQLAPARSGAGPITITNHNDFRGADPGSEARIKAYVDQSSQRAVQQAVEAVSRTHRTNPSYLGSRQ